MKNDAGTLVSSTYARVIKIVTAFYRNPFPRNPHDGREPSGVAVMASAGRTQRAALTLRHGYHGFKGVDGISTYSYRDNVRFFNVI